MIYPTSTTSISPYSEYNSEKVNQLTRMITLGEDCLKGTHSCEITIDSTNSSTCLILSTGTFFKDDCIHSIDEEFTIDMSSEDFYVNPISGWWNESGYYLILIDYTYLKAKPAPRVSIQILKPSQISSFSSTSYLFLKAVYVIFNGSTFEIVSVHDYLPSDPTIKRNYALTYIDVENTLPVFDSNRDEGRFIYTRDLQEMYFGKNGRWETNQSMRANIDTTGCSIGELVYVESDGKAYPALADSLNHLSSGVVLNVGLRTDGNGLVRSFGVCENVPVESGITIYCGDQLYLSGSESGKVTNVIPPTYPQYIGRAVSDSTGIDTVTIWFLPGSNIAATALLPLIIQKSDYDANSIIKADTDNTPSALVINENEIIGRQTGGTIDGISIGENEIVCRQASGTVDGLLINENEIVSRITGGTVDGLLINTNELVGRQNGTLKGISIDENDIVCRVTSGDIDGVPISTNSIVGRGSGTIVGISVGEEEIVCRLTSGELDGLLINENEIVARGSGSLDGISIGENEVVCRTSGGNIDGLLINENELLGRKTGGTLEGLTASELSSIINLPVGMPLPWAAETLPSGFLECNGAAISKVTYVTLYNVLKDGGGSCIYGESGGNFYLPDFRGRFLRGWDHAAGRDPDAASRTDRGDGSGGDHVGTTQLSANLAHTHTYSTNNQDRGGEGVVVPFAYNRVTENTGSSGGSEARPININVMWIIKYQ